MKNYKKLLNTTVLPRNLRDPSLLQRINDLTPFLIQMNQVKTTPWFPVSKSNENGQEVQVFLDQVCFVGVQL